MTEGRTTLRRSSRTKAVRRPAWRIHLTYLRQEAMLGRSTFGHHNHWGTNYRAYQEGPIEFRYALRPYLDWSSADSSKLALGFSQPLIASFFPVHAPPSKAEPRRSFDPR